MPDLAYFTPFRPPDPARARGCWTCQHFEGRFFGGHVLCERDGGRRVIGQPAAGCALWMRATGADDE